MKYFKPLSLTWWGGVAAIIGGVAMMKLGDYSLGFTTAVGGLTAVGLRGAIPDNLLKLADQVVKATQPANPGEGAGAPIGPKG
jgi:hypothetical protein